jgi:hypothetical protein
MGILETVVPKNGQTPRFLLLTQEKRSGGFRNFEKLANPRNRRG